MYNNYYLLIMNQTIRVLLIEDEPDVLESLSALLTRFGLTVLAAPDGKTVLDKQMYENVDIVVTDIRMPHIDGIALYKILRKKRPSLPVIFISSNAIDLTELGDSRHQKPEPSLLTKPFTSRQLADAIYSKVEAKPI